MPLDHAIQRLAVDFQHSRRRLLVATRMLQNARDMWRTPTFARDMIDSTVLGGTQACLELCVPHEVTARI